MASEWLKPPTMVPTTSLSFYPTLPHLLTTSLSSPPRSRVPVQLHPSSGCITRAFSMPSRLTGLAKEAQTHWKPHGATQSQPRGEREEGGVRGEERWRKEEAKVLVFFPTSLKSCSHFSCVIFSPSHIFLKISMDLHQNIFNHCFIYWNVKSWDKHMCTILGSSSSHLLLSEPSSLSSFLSSHPIIHSSLPHLTSSHLPNTRPGCSASVM